MEVKHLLLFLTNHILLQKLSDVLSYLDIQDLMHIIGISLKLNSNDHFSPVVLNWIYFLHICLLTPVKLYFTCLMLFALGISY